MRITQKAVNEAQTTGKELLLWDDGVKGFGLRVSRGGVKAYVVQYRRPDGKVRRFTIARVERLNVEQARGQARKLLAQVALGQDPAEEKAVAKEKAAADITLKAFAERYLSDHAEVRKKASSIRNDRVILDAHLLPDLGRKRMQDITRQDVTKLHNSLSKTPYMANRTLALLRKMMNLAEAWGIRPDGTNPCRHVQQFHEDARRRYLSGEELGRLGAAIDAAVVAADPDQRISDTAARFIRLLLFTGCRVNEILSLRWDEVDLDHGRFNLADSKTGAKTVPLSAAAILLLEETRHEVNNPYVLPGRHKNRQGERTHLSNPAEPWGTVRKQAGLEDVHLHDLRHTFASIGAGHGIGLPIIGSLLGHTQASTTQRYAHLAIDPQKLAADIIAGDIDAAMKKKPEGGQVIDMKTGKAKSN